MKDTKHNREWTDSIRESLKDFSTTPPDGGWENLQKGLKRNAIRRERKRIYYAISSIAAVAVLFLFLLLPNYHDNNNNQLLVDNNEQEKEAPIRVIEVPTTESNENDSNLAQFVAENRTLNRDKGERMGAKSVNEGVNADEMDMPKESNFSQVLDFSKESDLSSEKNIENRDNSDQKVNKEHQEYRDREVDDDSSKMTWEQYLANNEDDSDNRRRGKGFLSFNIGNSFQSTGAGDMLVMDRGDLMMDYIATTNSVADIENRKNGAVVTLSSVEPKFFEPGIHSYEQSYNHKQPFTIGVTINKELVKNLSFETGVQYTLMSSDISGYAESQKENKEAVQNLHYIGIPIKFNWAFLNKKNFGVYLGFGAVLERSVYAEINDERFDLKSFEKSANLSIGAQYNINKFLSIYIEPGLSYYIGIGKDGTLTKLESGFNVKSIRSETPLGFSVNGGFRFSL